MCNTCTPIHQNIDQYICIWRACIWNGNGIESETDTYHLWMCIYGSVRDKSKRIRSTLVLCAAHRSKRRANVRHFINCVCLQYTLFRFDILFVYCLLSRTMPGWGEKCATAAHRRILAICFDDSVLYEATFHKNAKLNYFNATIFGYNWRTRKHELQPRQKVKLLMQRTRSIVSPHTSPPKCHIIFIFPLYAMPQLIRKESAECYTVTTLHISNFIIAHGALHHAL